MMGRKAEGGGTAGVGDGLGEASEQEGKEEGEEGRDRERQRWGTPSCGWPLSMFKGCLLSTASSGNWTGSGGGLVKQIQCRASQPVHISVEHSSLSRTALRIPNS